MTMTDTKPEAPPEVRHKLCTARGTVVTWSPRNDDEVAHARRYFNEYRARRGAMMFAVDEHMAQKGTDQIRDFDPETDILIHEMAYSGG